MRIADVEPSILAADRALAIAERLDLEPIVAEALENKASALQMGGRRREGIALHEAALDLTMRLGDRSLELRIRNNYASGVADDDPQRSAQMLAESVELARDIGDRGIYYFQLGQLAIARFAEGTAWDEIVAALKEAFESSTLRFDRVRLRTFLGIIETARGENLDAYEAAITDLAGGHAGIEDRFTLALMRSEVALRRDKLADAFRWARDAFALRYQSPEVPVEAAVRAAARLGDPGLVREAGAMAAELPTSGAMTRAHQAQAKAAVAAVDGRIAEAVSGFADVQATLSGLGQRYLAALMAIDALSLLPNQPRLRELAEQSRPLLEELRAVADLRVLDAAIASAEPTSSTSRARTAVKEAPAP
jgi:hypothetical protein